MSDCEKALSLYHNKDYNGLAGIMPTRGGFFFGDVEYNEWYAKSLEHTIDKLSKILKEDEGSFSVDYYYSSSW